MSREADPRSDSGLPAAVPPAELEDRVVEALRAEGLLSGGAKPSGKPLLEGRAGGRWWGRTADGPGRAWWPVAVAASVALFAAGFAAGQFTGSRSTADALIAAREADATATAALVQQAGSAYVHALAALADRTGEDADPDAVRQGEAAALAAFTAAAAELARLDPDNQTAHQVLTLLTTRSEGGPSAASTQTLWF